MVSPLHEAPHEAPHETPHETPHAQQAAAEQLAGADVCKPAPDRTVMLIRLCQLCLVVIAILMLFAGMRNFLVPLFVAFMLFVDS